MSQYLIAGIMVYATIALVWFVGWTVTAILVRDWRDECRANLRASLWAPVWPIGALVEYVRLWDGR